MKFGLDLGRCNPKLWLDVARAGDEAGFDSVWLPEHLVMPASFDERPGDGGEHGRVDPTIPLFDPFAMLSALAVATRRIRLGTNVYNIGLRHPFSTARGAATVDVISGGRFDLGVGSSWLAREWEALELDFATRGSRVDESIRICRRLWTEEVVEHDGRHFSFPAVVFEPKPPQSSIPVHVGGDSPRALRRVAELGDGWIGMLHDDSSFARSTEVLRQLCDDRGRDFESIQRSALVANPSNKDVEIWATAGATRLIVAPWRRSTEAVEAISRFADQFGLAASIHPLGEGQYTAKSDVERDRFDP